MKQPEDNRTGDMYQTVRRRSVTGTALSAAQRMKAMRERKKQAGSLLLRVSLPHHLAQWIMSESDAVDVSPSDVVLAILEESYASMQVAASTEAGSGPQGPGKPQRSPSGRFCRV